MNRLLYALGHILSCKEASRYASRVQDGRLSAWERWKFEMHLKVCAKCTRFTEQLEIMREAMRRFRQ